MGSRKRSARARQRERFESGLEDGLGGLSGAFAREEGHLEDLAARTEEHRRMKACGSKARYATRAEAEAVALECAEHGRGGLATYQCPYCGGWHLTSHPWR